MSTTDFKNIGSLNEAMLPEEFDSASRAAASLNVPFVLLTTPGGTRVWVEAPQLPKPPAVTTPGN